MKQQDPECNSDSLMGLSKKLLGSNVILRNKRFQTEAQGQN